MRSREVGPWGSGPYPLCNFTLTERLSLLWLGSVFARVTEVGVSFASRRHLQKKARTGPKHRGREEEEKEMVEHLRLRRSEEELKNNS